MHRWQIVKELKESIESQIGCSLSLAGVAYPPGTMVGDQKAIKYVDEANAASLANGSMLEII